MLLLAALLLVLCGVAHSYLGERFILARLFKRDNLPHLYGSDVFTKGTLRFTWHITSLAWFGYAALLALSREPSAVLLYSTSLVFFASSGLAVFYTRFKHLSWLVFLAISGLTLCSALCR